ncbi:MAG: alpha-ketoglutarate-dependent dioxygenase AlkB [Alsobacter sp.]
MITIQPGVAYHPAALDAAAQARLVDDLRQALRDAPLFQPVMPRTGRPFSVRMSNCGELGWVSDRQGYRYQGTHPVTGRPWPGIPTLLLEAWARFSGEARPPQACLVNWYDATARMGMHQDRDEEDLAAPVLSVSLGDTAVFRIGGAERGGPTRSVKLASGDVLVLGGPGRLAHHGVDRVLPASSTLLGRPGRINCTLRRVTP